MADIQTGVMTKEGQPFYPQTQANLVKMEDGRTMEAHENDLKDEINDIKATLAHTYASPSSDLLNAVASIVRENYKNVGAFFFSVQSKDGTFAVWGYKVSTYWTMTAKQLSTANMYAISVTATTSSMEKMVTDEDTWKAGDVWDLPASGAFTGIISGTNAYITIQSPKKIPDNVKIALSDFELQSTPMLATTNGSKTNLTVDTIVVLGDRRTIRFRIANLSGVTTSTPCAYWGGFKITFS